MADLDPCTVIQQYVYSCASLAELDKDLIKDLDLLPYVRYPKTVVYSVEIFAEAIDKNYFGSPLWDQDYGYCYIVVRSAKGLQILFAHCQPGVTRCEGSDILKDILEDGADAKPRRAWLMFYGSDAKHALICSTPLHMVLDPACDPFFEDGQGYVNNIWMRHLIVTAALEEIVILPRAILDSEEQPYETLELKDQLLRSQDRDPLHPTKPTTIVTLLKERLPDPPVMSTHSIPLPGPPGGTDTGPTESVTIECETTMEVGEGENLGDGPDAVSEIPGLIPVRVDESQMEEPPPALAEDITVPTPATRSSKNTGVRTESSTAMDIIPPEEEDWMRPIQEKYSAINRDLLCFEDEALNLFMTGCLTRHLLALNASNALQCLRVEEAREVAKMENELSYITVTHDRKLALLLTSMKTSRFVAQMSRDKEREEACTLYERNLEKIEENFKERCGVNTAAYNRGVAMAASSARDSIVEKLSAVYDVLAEHRHDCDTTIRSKEVVVDEMVCRLNRSASWLRPTQDADVATDESEWIAKKFKAVSATLSLEGKGELPVSIDSLLQARPSIIHSILCLSGVSLITSQFEELDLGDDFSTKQVCEYVLKLARAI